MISGYCLVLVPYFSSTFPKHGLYIHEYIDIHSPVRAGRSVRCSWRVQFFDAAASWRLKSRDSVFSPSSPLYFPNGTFQISVKLLQWESTQLKPLDQPPSRGAKKKKKTSPLNLNPIRAFSFEIWLTNTATWRDGDGESAAFHNDSHIISHKSRHES